VFVLVSEAMFQIDGYARQAVGRGLGGLGVSNAGFRLVLPGAPTGQGAGGARSSTLVSVKIDAGE
jgi:hypothetical protein